MIDFLENLALGPCVLDLFLLSKLLLFQDLHCIQLAIALFLHKKDLAI